MPGTFGAWHLLFWYHTLMAIHPVLTYPQAALLMRAERVNRITDRERVLVRDMIDTMHAEKGVGLAANQIGIKERIFVVSEDGRRGNERVFFNPQIVRRSGWTREQEGCLSVPGVWEPVTRSRRVTLKALDIEGKEIEIKAEGLLARILQHEVDHLNGRLFVHRLGLLRRRRCIKMLDEKVRGL